MTSPGNMLHFVTYPASNSARQPYKASGLMHMFGKWNWFRDTFFRNPFGLPFSTSLSSNHNKNELLEALHCLLPLAGSLFSTWAFASREYTFILFFAVVFNSSILRTIILIAGRKLDGAIVFVSISARPPTPQVRTLCIYFPWCLWSGFISPWICTKGLVSYASRVLLILQS